MSTGQTVTVTITLRLGAEPIEGSLHVSGADPRGFRGWLELTSLLRAATESPDACEDRQSVTGGASARGQQADTVEERRATRG